MSFVPVEKDDIRAVEHVAATEYSDRIVGTSADERLYGAGGHDTLIGKGGTDALIGGSGIDTLDNRDGEMDKPVNCGYDSPNTVLLDPIDPPSFGC